MSGHQLALEGTESSRPKSAFSDKGMLQVIEDLKNEIRKLYLEERTPIVIGWSGGKDSTACLQLVWTAIAELPAEDRITPIHVITTDTMVENPVVSAYVSGQLDRMNEAARKQGMPIEAHKLVPDVKDRFWTCLIGRGYAAPRPMFRWCTDRLKIKPSNRFIRQVISQAGEAILVLGTRKAESAARARTMKKHEAGRIRDRLSPNGSLPGSLIYSPVETWSNDDIWVYLMQVPSPFGGRNHDLLTLYSGATEDGECPLVVDESTPSCGDSRFGCWTCTMVEQDKSMKAMVHNDEAKDWLAPLIALRDALDVRGEDGERDDYALRDFRRMDGRIQLFHSEEPAPGKTQRETLVPGPYLQHVREDWLRRVLEAQAQVRKIGPPEVANIELISPDELDEIRRIWVEEKHEFEDSLPVIYEEVTGEKYPGKAVDDDMALNNECVEILRELCGEDEQHFQMVREMLSIERQERSKLRRNGILDRLERSLATGGFEGQGDALQWALECRRKLSSDRPAEGEQQVLDSTLT